jgi:hypothetical protein
LKYFLWSFFFVLFVGLAITPASETQRSADIDSFFAELHAQHIRNAEHRQRAALIKFFRHYHAVTPYPITDYINASEPNQIDYRLLPAISIAESSGGVHACGANWWGWGSCKGYNFRSVAEGIQFVTHELASGNYYRGKTIDQQLRAYNPNPAYAVSVERLMKEISP